MMRNNPDGNDIIVADNDSIVRGILRSVLENQGFAVLPTANGMEAVELATRTRARLVILDYKMPRLDGFATCAEIRKLAGYGEIPIVILTAFNDAGVREKAERAGATAFLAKPFTSVNLLRMIAELLGSSPSPGPDASNPPGRANYLWNRRPEPTPLFGEPAEYSNSRRILGICRASPEPVRDDGRLNRPKF